MRVRPGEAAEVGFKWVGNLCLAQSHTQFQCTLHGDGARDGSILSRRASVCYRVDPIQMAASTIDAHSCHQPHSRTPSSAHPLVLVH